MKKIFLLFLALALFCFGLTTLFLSMRAIMTIGGYCAEGGPYVIANHCPGGTGWLTPLSIFIMLGATLMYFIYSAAFTNSPRWGYFFWSALFLSLGWNFLEFAIIPPQGGIDISWLLCGVMFVVMGAGPLFIFKNDLTQMVNTKTMKDEPNSLKQILFGKNKTKPALETKFYETQTFLLLIHLLGLFGGIYLGYLAFINT